MRSESSEYVSKTTGICTNGRRIKIALESYFDVRGKEDSEINWMNLEVLLNTYPPKVIATILKALREQVTKNEQFNAVEEIADSVPEIPIE